MSEIYLIVLFCLSAVNSICLVLVATAIRIELKTREAKRRIQQPSEDLEDFLTDIRSHGYGFVRVDPASVFYRGRKDI